MAAMPEADDPDQERSSDPSSADLGDPTDVTETIGAVDPSLEIRYAEAAAGIPGFDGFALVVTSGPRRGAHWVLEEGVWEAGRNTEAFLFLDDVTVSRHHAEFRVADARLSVKDLGSTNGTYVNGRRVEHTVLHAADEVIIGRFHLVVARGL